MTSLLILVLLLTATLARYESCSPYRNSCVAAAEKVCGYNLTGGIRIYATKCQACMDARVVAFTSASITNCSTVAPANAPK